MSPPRGIGLPEALERAARALPAHADGIRPANGDPASLAASLDAAGAAAVLEWLLRHEPAEGAELAGAWAEDPETGAAALLAVRGGDLSKEGRKALRRALHRLRSRGVNVPDEPAESVVAKLPPVQDRLEEALVSPLDPRGTRVVYLAESGPAGGARVFEVVLDEERGIVDFEMYEGGRSRIRKLLREIGGRDRYPPVPTTPAAVRALLRRAAAAQPDDRPAPRAFAEWQGHLAGAAGGAAPGDLAREALGVPEDVAPLRRAAELVRSLELGPWPPRDAALEKAVERIEEAAKGRIVVSEVRRREQIDRTLGELAGELFAGAAGETAARRFEESAYVVWRGGREDEARACLAAARAFREGGSDENPVARAMLEVLLAPLLERLEKEAEAGEGSADAVAAPDEGQDETSLLVKP